MLQEAAFVMTTLGRVLLAAGLLTLSPTLAQRSNSARRTVIPLPCRLNGPAARHSLLITGRTADSRLIDRTYAARYQSLDPPLPASLRPA